MACEQCDFREEAYFCSYIQLLNSFVVSEKDVDLLIKKNIIVNNFGSHRAVAEMINNLTVELVLPTGLYSEIGRDLNLYYERSWNPTIRTLKHVYFKNIWRGTATIVASIVDIGGSFKPLKENMTIDKTKEIMQNLNIWSSEKGKLLNWVWFVNDISRARLQFYQSM
ncbi:Protein of unknown function DUF247 [Theobroma cacao]|nr:Protein of unknown function DUF247 [Theobroma cacao]